MKGSVYQRINPKTDKKTKTWNYTIDVPRELTGGKRKQITKGGFKTQKEADKAMVAKIAELNNGIFVEPNKLTLGEALERWLEKHVKINTQHATYLNSFYVVKRVKEQLGHYKLGFLTPEHIDDFYGLLKKEGMKETTIRQYHVTLKSAFKKLKKWRLIANNIMEDVDAPKVHQQEERAFMTPEQIVIFLDAVKKSRAPYYYDVLLFAIAIGARKGEVLALKWSDVDFEKQTITISRTLKRSDKGGFEEGNTTKTKKTRVLNFDQIVIDIFEGRKKQQRYEKLMAGPAYSDKGYIFSNPLGEHYNYDTMSGFVQKLCKKTGLNGINFHATRHTNASLLLMKNVHIMKVKENLGHTTIAMTSKYSHVMPQDTEVAVTINEELTKIIPKLLG